MLAKLGLDDRHTLASWWPDRDRRRLPGLLALPPALASLGRPLLWAGTAFGGMAIVAVVVVLLVTFLGDDEDEHMTLSHTLTATAGEGGSVTPDGTTTHGEGAEVVLVASWNDATHSFSGWGGHCEGTASTCALTMDGPKTVTAMFVERCTTGATDPTCIRAVYLGAPGDYAQAVDIPADVLLTANSDGRYYVERGQQYTVVTAAPLPEGWTRFYLERTPLGDPRPVSHEQLVAPVGTTYTFMVTTDPGASTLITFDLKEARPFVRPRPDGKPEIGDTVVTTVFEALPAPELTLVSRGEHDAFKLEWTGGPTNVTTWQYRQRSWQDGRPLEWGDWTDIPSSGAATRGYRLTELTERTGYSVELRGVVGPLTGPASNSVGASTHHRTNHPEMYPGDVVEGDGQTEWRLHRLGVLITIPAGKRLTVGQGSIAQGWVGTGDDRWLTLGQVDLYDEVTGSVLVLDSDTGREVSRRVVEAPAPEGSPSNGLGGVSEESDAHDANALFDQIVASVRVD